MFDFFKKNKSENVECAATVPKISLEKHQENLNSFIDLRKDLNLDNHKAAVVMGLDYSGSMDTLYSNGDIQELLSRILPLALKFDDDGVLDTHLFSDTDIPLVGMNLSNYATYVNDVMIKHRMGCTYYAPTLLSLLNQYSEAKQPVFVIFITDGDNADHAATEDVIRKLSHTNVFIQFVGIGHAGFSFLEKLDNLSGRACDNTSFIKVSSFSSLDDAHLYEYLLSQYAEWIQAKGLCWQ